MNKAYWIVPLLSLLVFAAVYSNFKSDYDARVKSRQEHMQAEKQARLQAETEARRKAVDAAVRAQAERQRERDAKEAEERARQEARQAALDARDQAFHEQGELTKQIENLKRDIASEQDAVAQINRDRQSALEEQAFLKAYIVKAQDNVKALEAVLAKITAVEIARMAAEAINKENF